MRYISPERTGWDEIDQVELPAMIASRGIDLDPKKGARQGRTLLAILKVSFGRLGRYIETKALEGVGERIGPQTASGRIEKVPIS